MFCDFHICKKNETSNLRWGCWKHWRWETLVLRVSRKSWIFLGPNSTLFWNKWWIHISADKSGLLHSIAEQYTAMLEAHCPVQRSTSSFLPPPPQTLISIFQNHLNGCIFPLLLPVGSLFGPDLFAIYLSLLALFTSLSGQIQYRDTKTIQRHSQP